MKSTRKLTAYLLIFILSFILIPEFSPVYAEDLIISNIITDREFVGANQPEGEEIVYKTGILENGAKVYTDNESYTYIFDESSAKTTDSMFANSQYIMTAYDDQFENREPFLKFDVNQNVNVYIVIQGNFKMDETHWFSVNNFEEVRSGGNAYPVYISNGSTAAAYKVFKRTFKAGTIELGGNNTAGLIVTPRLMYSVIVQPTDETPNEAPMKFQKITYGDIPAFPGAEGGGKYATGGRGGEIYHVTNLNDSGVGSLRDALSKSNRIVVFDVSGVIELKSAIKSFASNLTVAGQTAPGSGITVKNYYVSFHGDNVIVRFMRFRPGSSTLSDMDGVGSHAKTLHIYDHISTSWSSDELFSAYRMKDTTIQWSNVSESNLYGGHSKGAHGYGGINGGINFTYHHNLLAHNLSRNVRFSFANLTEYSNNVVYDWGGKVSYGDWQNLNYRNNYFKPGPSTKNKDRIAEESGTANYQYNSYFDGNKFYGNDAVEKDNYKFIKNGNLSIKNKLSSPLEMTDGAGHNVSYVPVSADTAYNEVLNYSGARLPLFDENDQRIFDDVKNGTGSITYDVIPSMDDSAGSAKLDETIYTAVMNSINSCKAKYAERDYGEQYTLPKKADANNDGIPDEWCIERGLDPTANIASLDYTGDGYTNIEKYLNDLTVSAFPDGVVKTSPLKSYAEFTDKDGNIISTLDGLDFVSVNAEAFSKGEDIFIYAVHFENGIIKNIKRSENNLSMDFALNNSAKNKIKVFFWRDNLEPFADMHSITNAVQSGIYAEN